MEDLMILATGVLTVLLVGVVLLCGNCSSKAEESRNIRLTSERARRWEVDWQKAEEEVDREWDGESVEEDGGMWAKSFGNRMLSAVKEFEASKTSSFTEEREGKGEGRGLFRSTSKISEVGTGSFDKHYTLPLITDAYGDDLSDHKPVEVEEKPPSEKVGLSKTSLKESESKETKPKKKPKNKVEPSTPKKEKKDKKPKKDKKKNKKKK